AGAAMSRASISTRLSPGAMDTSRVKIPSAPTGTTPPATVSWPSPSDAVTRPVTLQVVAWAGAKASVDDVSTVSVYGAGASGSSGLPPPASTPFGGELPTWPV